jgi:hypothetical protein
VDEMERNGLKWDGMSISGIGWVQEGWNGFKWEE